MQCLKLTRASHLLATPSLFATLTLLPHDLPDLKVSHDGAGPALDLIMLDLQRMCTGIL